MSKLVFASVISEIQQSDIFMTVKARICETPAANLNGARVTEAFIDEIVGNEKYVGLPLNADIKALISGKYNRLGHLYDAKTGEFHSTQIGSFYRFEKETFENGCYLVGYARIPKRNKKLSKAISELFADGNLKFSFELSVGEYEEMDDDTILIDASENNYLEGTAIVTFPACREAVALELVAQKADDAEGGEEEMADVQKPAEELAEEAQAEAAEAEANEIASPETVQAEETETEEQNETVQVEAEAEEQETVQAEEQNEEAEEATEEDSVQENASVVVREEHTENHSVDAYDTETGVEVRQNISVTTETIERQEGQIIQTTDGVHVAEDGDPVQTPVEEPAEEPAEEPETKEVVNTDSVENKKTAEEMIAELVQVIEGLKTEIASLKEQKQITAEINPFMSDLSTKGKYSLLEKDETNERRYSLLEKA